MKTYKSLVAVLALSSVAFGGGNISPVTEYENTDYSAAQEVEVVPEVVPEVKVVEPVVEEKVIPVEVAPIASAMMGGYVGLGATGIAHRVSANSAQSNVFRELGCCQDRQMGVTGVAGYDFDQNLGAELRGTFGQWEISNGKKLRNVGAYLKPQVDLGGVNLYGLAGYAVTGSGTTGTGDKEGDFSYGAGLDVTLTEEFKLFGDLVQYIDKGKVNAMGATAGLKYQF
ncbi:MAG: hypothetical protein KN64_11135 [Sulfurovum sp. AS07-7]|nr:MAG: hypothetical protein KN64_11135 [Sulfurovum sp. AS07-7]